MWGKEDENEEGEEGGGDEEDDPYKSVNDHILFLIDAREDMHSKNKSGETHFLNSLKVALAVMKSKIISSDKDSVGIILFGVDDKKDTTDSLQKFVNTLIPLAKPSADRILTLKNLVQEISNGNNPIKGLPKTIKGCPLKEALWLCTQSFNIKSSAISRNDYRRVWIFTNDDNPSGAFPATQQQILQVAKDSHEAGVEISLWHMNKVDSKQQFNTKLFYDKLLKIGIEEDDDDEDSLASRIQAAGDESFEMMVANVRKKEFKKRRLSTMYVQLHPDIVVANGESEDVKYKNCIAVGYYKTIMPTKKPQHVWLMGATSEPAKHNTTYVDTSTGQVIDATNPEQMSTYVEISGSGERIYLSKAEMTVCKLLRPASTKSNLPESILKVLAFIPVSTLDIDINLTCPGFIFPDDATIKGSSQLFSTIIQQMVAKRLAILAVMARTKASAPRMVALVPHADNVGTDDETWSGGMDVITLPYANEIRAAPENPNALEPHVSEEGIEAAEAIIKQFQFEDDFRYENLENPLIQKVYGVLQALALNEEADPNIDDKLQPDAEAFAEHADLFLRFKEINNVEDMAEGGVKKPTKRSAASRAAPAAKGSKKSKVEKGDNDDGDNEALFTANGDLNMAYLQAHSTEEELMKESAANLKEICRNLSLPVSGAKAVLVTRIISGLGN